MDQTDEMTITQFIKARLAEAKALIERNSDRRGLAEGWPDKCTYWDADWEAAVAYVEHFTPVRMGRQVAAAERVLLRHRRTGDVLSWASDTEQCYGCGSGEYDHYPVAIQDCPELRDLAAVWNDHADYREEKWLPW